MTSKISLCIATLAVGLTPALASAQYAEDFEGYAPGQFVEPVAWENWWGGPGSAIVDTTIVADPAGGGGQALRVEGAADPVLVVERAMGFPVISGAWEVTLWQYTPSTSTGDTYYIWLNNYDPAQTNWSVQCTTNASSGVFTDTYSGNSADAVLDEWVELKMIVDLADGVSTQGAQYFFYNGTLLYDAVWDRDAIGTNKLDGMDLYSAGPVNHFDDISIDPAEITGACCVVDGTCVSASSLDDCIAAGGYDWTLFAPCTEDRCPQYVPGEGWLIDAPFTWDGDTTFQAQECALGDANDEIFAVNIPYAGPWTFSLCGDDTIDSYIAIGSAPCLEDLGTDDDTCGVQPEITLELPAGMVYVTVTSLFGEEGVYNLNVDAPCVGAIEVVGTSETEACGDDTNGGCNMPAGTRQFEATALGVQQNGTLWIDAAGTRDTDWWTFTNADGNERVVWVGHNRVGDVIECGAGYDSYNMRVEQAGPGAETVMHVEAEASMYFGIIGNADGPIGPTEAECDAGGLGFLAIEFINPCQTGTGASLVIEEGSVSCEPSNGDTNGDGVVNVEDLLTVLGDWGCTGACDGDTNCDEVTDVSDLLDVLGNWS